MDSASFDLEKVKDLERIPTEENTSKPGSQEEVFFVILPRWQHKEERCLEAKEKELKNWDDFGTFSEVQDEGQKTLGLNWILTEKVVDGKPVVKARLCVRGDLEEPNELRTDSPTINKTNIKLFLLIAASKGWDVKTADIRCAFLQGSIIDRDIYVKPPMERRIKGVIWKMEKMAYGLIDAARGFYLELSKSLQELGCIQSTLDPALYYWNDSKQEMAGMILTHVDDVLHGSGTSEFETKVMDPLRKRFQFGAENQLEF